MIRFLTVAGVAVMILAGAPAQAQMGPGLDLSWNTIDCGGGVVSSGALSLFGTIGQPDAGVMTGGGLELLGGFIGGAGGPPPCYPDCDGDGILTLADFGCFQTKFGLGDLYADCDGDALLTLADFGCFQTAFGLGCP
jgi:hypothetical protein